MNLDNPITLSICIPTYNRCDEIKRQTDFFLSECKNNENVELIISDNCSDDDTFNYLQSIEDASFALTTCRQSKNLGLMGNMVSLIESAQGEYVWLVGDDDILKPGVVRAVLDSIIECECPSLIFLNYNEEMKGCGYFSKIAGYYDSGIDLFDQVTKVRGNFGSMMFMSASIHKRENAREYIGIFKDIGEYAAGNLAFPLGLSLYSCIKGAGYLVGETFLYDEIQNISWKEQANRVRHRDMLAVMYKTIRYCGLSAKELGIDLDRFLPKYSEFYYLFCDSNADNFALKYRLRNKPRLLFSDFVGFAFLQVRERLGR